MWVFSKYMFFIVMLLLVTLTFTDNYIYFALSSELCWVGIYTISILYGSLLEDSFLYISCILVMLLTAIEGIVIWSMIFLIKLR